MTLDDYNKQLIKVLWLGARDIDQMCKEASKCIAGTITQRPSAPASPQG